MIYGRIKNLLKNKEPKAVVLMYHRVCDLETDPWGLAVSQNNFESQIELLTQNFKVLPVSDLAKQLNSGNIQHKSVYVTFDDSYRDNYIYAKPTLEKYACPATFFVPTHFIGKQELFWWDELEFIILHSVTLPSSLKLQVEEQTYMFDFEIEPLSKENIVKQKAWRWPAEPPTKRCEIYLKIWEILKPLPYSTIVETLNRLRNWSGFDSSLSHESFPMTEEELKILASNPLFDLGLHTHTHAALPNHSPEIQKKEIGACENFLRENKYQYLKAIAYPYGNYGDETLYIVEQNKLELGFTTREEPITQHAMPLCLGRFQINNDDGIALKKNLLNLFE